MEVIARINTSTPAGRKIVRELEKNKNVSLQYPLPNHLSGTIDDNVDEVFDNLMDRLNKYHGTNFKY